MNDHSSIHDYVPLLPFIHGFQSSQHVAVLEKERYKTRRWNAVASNGFVLISARFFSDVSKSYVLSGNGFGLGGMSMPDVSFEARGRNSGV
jgi:hypothetical protein